MAKKDRRRAPKYEEKRIMSSHGLEWKNWLVELSDETELVVVSKKSGQHRTLKKTK